MNRLVHVYSVSLSGFRNMLPVIAALVAMRSEQTCIASSIPGLGACKSRFCKPVRRAIAGLH